MDRLVLCHIGTDEVLPQHVVTSLVSGNGAVTLAILALIRGWTTEYEFDVSLFKEIADQPGSMIGFMVEIPGIIQLEIGIRLDSETCTDDQAMGVVRRVNGSMIHPSRQIGVVLTRVPSDPKDLIAVRVDTTSTSTATAG